MKLNIYGLGCGLISPIIYIRIYSSLLNFPIPGIERDPLRLLLCLLVVDT